MRATRLTDAQRQMVDENLRLASAAVNEFANLVPMSYSDKMGEAYLEMSRAALAFDPQKGKYSTQVNRYIKHRFCNLRKYYRAQKRQAGFVSLDGKSSARETVVGVIPSPFEEIARQESAEQVRKAVEQLYPRQRKIIRLVFGLDRRGPLETWEIAEMLGCSQDAVRAVKNKGLKRLRKIMAEPSLAD